MSFPFKNLVFEGGGVKGVAYIGALSVLEEDGVLDGIQRVAGSSAGAITAMLVSFHEPVSEGERIFNTLDFTKISGNDMSDDSPYIPNFIEDPLEKVLQGAAGAGRLLLKFGWNSSSYVHNWVKQVVASQCDGNSMATFREFRQRGFRDLYVVTTNLSDRKPEIFSVESSPDVAVADAVRMSMSLPLFFEALRFDGRQFGRGDYYVDGGAMLNYAIQIFDRPRYMTNQERWVHGLNWETLGCNLYTPLECGDDDILGDFLGYAERLMEVITATQINDLNNRPYDLRRSLGISDLCTKPTDFGIHPGTPKYNALVAEGRRAAKEFLTNYSGIPE